jgi:hypothetical protein
MRDTTTDGVRRQPPQPGHQPATPRRRAALSYSPALQALTRDGFPVLALQRVGRRLLADGGSFTLFRLPDGRAAAIWLIKRWGHELHLRRPDQQTEWTLTFDDTEPAHELYLEEPDEFPYTGNAELTFPGD